jgi:hypothetical protein
MDADEAKALLQADAAVEQSDPAPRKRVMQ